MNKQIWEMYKASSRGQEAIKLFTFDSENDDLETKVNEIFQKYNEYFGGSSVEDCFVDNCFLTLDSIIADKLFLKESESATDYFIRLVDNLEICIVEEDSNGELVRVKNEPPIILKED